MTRYLLAATLVIGVARLLLAIPSTAPPTMAAALEMREHLAREGLIDGVKCMSCAPKPDVGGVRYLPKDHKDSFWPHLRRLYAKTSAEMVVPEYLMMGGCRVGPMAPESVLEALSERLLTAQIHARSPSSDDALQR